MRNCSATAHASGPPPKVVPCRPGWKAFETASETALDLVENQRRAGFFGQRPRGFEELAAGGTYPALSLHGFNANRAHLGVELPLEIGNIVEAHEADAGHHGREWLAVFDRVGGCHGAERASMEGLFHGQHPPFTRAVFRFQVGRDSRQLERSFKGFGAAVAEEHPVQSGSFGQPRRQLDRVLVKEQIRGVDQLSGLRRNRLGDRGVRIAERVHPDSAQKVQIRVAFRVVDVNALAASQQNWIAIVGRDQEFAFGCLYGRESCHWAMTSVPASIRL